MLITCFRGGNFPETAFCNSVIDLSAVTAITSFSDLTANHPSTVAGNAETPKRSP